MAQVPNRLPGFCLHQGVDVPRGDLVFLSRPRAGLALFVVLEVNRDSDAFNIALAWSAGDDELPRVAAMEPTDAPVGNKHRFSFSRLWDTGTSRDPWHWRVSPLPSLEDTDAWLAPELSDSDLKQRLESLASDALNRLEEDASKYFATVVELH